LSDRLIRARLMEGMGIPFFEGLIDTRC
jgi:hypothetical protein